MMMYEPEHTISNHIRHPHPKFSPPTNHPLKYLFTTFYLKVHAIYLLIYLCNVPIGLNLTSTLHKTHNLTTMVFICKLHTVLVCWRK